MVHNIAHLYSITGLKFNIKLFVEFPCIMCQWLLQGMYIPQKHQRIYVTNRWSNR